MSASTTAATPKGPEAKSAIMARADEPHLMALFMRCGVGAEGQFRGAHDGRFALRVVEVSVAGQEVRTGLNWRSSLTNSSALPAVSAEESRGNHVLRSALELSWTSCGSDPGSAQPTPVTIGLPPSGSNTDGINVGETCAQIGSVLSLAT